MKHNHEFIEKVDKLEEAKGVLVVDYLEKGKTINSESTADVLEQIHQKFEDEKRHWTSNQ